MANVKIAKKKIMNGIIFAMFLMFLMLCLHFFVSFNWAQSFLLENYPFAAGQRHYADHLDSYLNKNVFKINSHVLLAIAMLILGILQFSTKLRARAPKIHRTVGYLYYIVGFTNVSLGLYLSDKTLGGFTAQISNYLTGFIWFFSSIAALRSALKRQFKQHELWAYRSFVIAMSTGLIRPVELALDTVFPGNSTAVLFGVSSWTSLVIGLLICAYLSDLTHSKSESA